MGKKENAKGNKLVPFPKGDTMAVPKGCSDSGEAHWTTKRHMKHLAICYSRQHPLTSPTSCKGKCGFLCCKLLFLLQFTVFVTSDRIYNHKSK